MESKNFDLSKYLQRIGFAGKPAADLASITEMMRRQLFTVPFENLDVQAGKIVSLVPEEIVEKIIDRQRGGYCYEVNGLFAMALAALGIPYQFAAARPMFYPSRRPKTHMVVIAHIDDQAWLCDLGFGSYGIRQPMRMDILDTPVLQDFDQFKLSKINEREYLMQALVEGEWANQYSFDLSFQEWIDFMPANYMNSTHPDAIFVRKLLVVLHQAEGRTILFGQSLKTVTATGVEQRKIEQKDIPDVLNEVFGLDGT